MCGAMVGQLCVDMLRYAQIRIVSCWGRGVGGGGLLTRGGGGPFDLILGPSGESAKSTIEHEPQVNGMDPYINICYIQICLLFNE